MLNADVLFFLKNWWEPLLRWLWMEIALTADILWMSIRKDLQVNPSFLPSCECHLIYFSPIDTANGENAGELHYFVFRSWFILSIFSALPQRLFFPVFKPHAWEQGVDHRLNNNQAERVGVTGSSFPQVHEAVLFDEDFVTTSVLSERLLAMRADMSQAALVHCRGMRMISAHQIDGIHCEVCYEENFKGYICKSCLKAVCISCFPMAFRDRVSENATNVSIEYQCPYCRSKFASFPQVPVLEEQVMDT